MFHILLQENKEKKTSGTTYVLLLNLCIWGRYVHCCEVYAHMCKSAQIYTCVEFIGHVSSLISSPPFFLRWVFFTEPLLIWLGSFKALPLCLPHNPALSPSITGEYHHARSFLRGCWETELRTSCLHGRNDTDRAISPDP